MGEDAGPEFVNMAVRVQTTLNPESLLRLLQQIESEFRRVRTVHWGPRPLDLDLLLYGNSVIATQGLVIPHPGLWYRRFVLDPLMDFAADDIHPKLAMSIRQLRARLNLRPLTIEIDGPKDLEIRLSAEHIRDPGECSVRRVHQRELEPVPDEVFARFVVDPNPKTCGSPARFVLQANRDTVGALIDSVLTAALGR